MPELPEVETVVRTLENRIKDATIEKVEIIYPRIIDNISPKEFADKLVNQSFRNFSRRGKYLMFALDDEMLIVHLRMEGKFYVEGNDFPIDSHTHVVFHLSDGRKILYNDVRKFGRMYLYPLNTEYTCLNNLGREPWDLSCEYLKSKIKKQSLKEFLLDQSIIAGVGNIYANEICFALGILPTREVNELSDQQLNELIRQTQKILENAIALGGTTIRSYTSSLGVTGRFQINLKVHGQSECKICHNKIEKIRWKGRGTYFCPHCQK